jgi:hypothetical protein
MGIIPKMHPCEICGGVFPIDSFAFHNCYETEKQIEEEKTSIDKWQKDNQPLNQTEDAG